MRAVVVGRIVFTMTSARRSNARNRSRSASSCRFMPRCVCRGAGRASRELAQRTAIGRLDHDHFGAAVGEELRRLCSRQRRRQVDHHEPASGPSDAPFGIWLLLCAGKSVRTWCDARHASIAAPKINVKALVLRTGDNSRDRDESRERDLQVDLVMTPIGRAKKVAVYEAPPQRARNDLLACKFGVAGRKGR